MLLPPWEENLRVCQRTDLMEKEWQGELGTSAEVCVSLQRDVKAGVLWIHLGNTHRR